MDIGLWSGVTGSAAAVIGLAVAWYYGHRSTTSAKPSSAAPTGPQVEVSVTTAFPTYDLPNGESAIGDHFVLVKAINTGDRAVTITGWGVQLPGDRRVVVIHPENWSTPLPHRLEPGSAPTQFPISADYLYGIGREQRVPFEQMRAYVTLADDTDVHAEYGVPLGKMEAA